MTCKNKWTIGILVVTLGFTTSPSHAQTKFLTWLRERIGEREAKDPDQAQANTKWQEAHFADSAAKETVIAAVTKEKCNVCHLKGKKKTERNDFGKQLSKALQEELKFGGKAITAALRTTAPEETRIKVEKAFYTCLEKTLEAPVTEGDDSAEKFGERVKRGELPWTP